MRGEQFYTADIILKEEHEHLGCIYEAVALVSSLLKFYNAPLKLVNVFLYIIEAKI